MDNRLQTFIDNRYEYHQEVNHIQGNYTESISNSVFRFLSDYQKLYTSFYEKATYDDVKLKDLIRQLNKTLIHILSDYISIITINGLDTDIISAYLVNILNGLNLGDSIYYNHPDDLIKLYSLSHFFNRQMGYTNDKERRLIDNFAYVACNTLSNSTFSNTKMIILDLLLSVKYMDENKENALLDSLVVLFELFNIVRLNPESLTELYTELIK